MRVLSTGLRVESGDQVSSLLVNVFFPRFGVQLRVGPLSSIGNCCIGFTSEFVMFQQISYYRSRPSFQCFLVTGYLSLGGLRRREHRNL